MFLFICFEIEKERQREGERIPSRLHSVSAEPDMGFDFTNHEIMTWAKIKSWTLSEPPVCPENTCIPNHFIPSWFWKLKFENDHIPSCLLDDKTELVTLSDIVGVKSRNLHIRGGICGGFWLLMYVILDMLVQYALFTLYFKFS